MADKVTLLKSAENLSYEILLMVLSETHDKYQQGVQTDQPQLQAALNNWAAAGNFTVSIVNPPAPNVAA